MKKSTTVIKSMKNCLAFAIVIAIVSCSSNKQPPNPELESANQQKDSLLLVLQEKDSTVTSFLQSYSEIQQTLDSVAMRGNTISKNVKNQVELRPTAKERINNDIIAINNLMKENRMKIAALNARLKSTHNKNAQLIKLIAGLNDQLVLKDCDLEILNDRLAKLSNNVIKLQTNIDSITSNANAQTAVLHTAYYVVGESKKLKEMEIIDKKGGLLGIGRTAKLNSNVDNTKFTRIDYTQTKTIAITSKKAKIVTTHPENSYLLEKDADGLITLHITDAEQFWSESKYLVIINN